MTKILGLLAVLATVSSVSLPAFAAEENELAPSNESMRGGIVCYARNARGRSFEAFGGLDSSRYFVERRAVGMCRLGSVYILRHSCHATGCRRIGWIPN